MSTTASSTPNARMAGGAQIATGAAIAAASTKAASTDCKATSSARRISPAPTCRATIASVPVATAIRLTALFQVGGIGGALVLGALLDRYFSFWVLAACFLWAAVCVFLIGASGASTLLLAATIASAGLGIIGGQNACHALTASFYPTAIRSTGVGWALGIGRIGSIVGPVLGGLLLARGVPIGQVFWVAAIPALIATLAAAGIALMGSDRRAAH